jgi:hypoxanthine-DNA glycosylase
VAVGEIGLDHFVPGLDRERQQHFYLAQLKLARDAGLPVILHVRRSADALLPGCAASRCRGGIAHAFNGSAAAGGAVRGARLRLGFGGAMTFERALQIRRLAAGLPDDALVLETDAPDIPPHWLYRTPPSAAGAAAARNEPAELPRIAADAGRAARLDAGTRQLSPAPTPARHAPLAAHGRSVARASRCRHRRSPAAAGPAAGDRRTRGWWCWAAFPARPRCRRSSTTPTRATSSGPAVGDLGHDLRRPALPQRLAELRAAHGLGLWDVYASCRREGSLDSAIEDAELQRPGEPARRAPLLQAVAHNGGESARAMRAPGGARAAGGRLPSTSPANASWSFERKLAAWREVFEGCSIVPGLSRRDKNCPPSVTMSEFDGVRYLHLGTIWVQGAMRIRKPQQKVELDYVQRMLASLLWLPTEALGQGRPCSWAWAPAAITRFTCNAAAHATTVVEINPAVIESPQLVPPAAATRG